MGVAVVVSRGLVAKALRAVVLVSPVWLANVSRYRRSRSIRLRERWPLTKPAQTRRTRNKYGASMLRNHTIPLRGIVGLGRSKRGEFPYILVYCHKM